MILTTDVIKKATEKAEEILRNHPNGIETFSGAIRLVQQCNAIGAQADIEKNNLIRVQIAALFVFTGFNSNSGLSQSVENATSFLKCIDAEEDDLNAVSEYILSITPPQIPMSSGAQVLCDALNSFWVEHTKNIQVDLPKTVLNFLTGSNVELTTSTLLEHLQKMKFFTPAARKSFEKPLKKKTQFLQERLALEKSTNEGGSTSDKVNPSAFANIFENYEKPALARGIETMFRIASREHTSLLGIVHQKAGFLASINAIILSVIISVLSTKLQDNMHLIVPTIMLMLTCLGTIYFAVVATRPVTINKATGDFDSATQNILFFGHYTHVDWLVYRDELKRIATNSNELFDILSKNIYYQGHVLKKKYNILARGYNFFIGGLAASVIAFIISYFTI